jgi:hypothetical protein
MNKIVNLKSLTFVGLFATVWLSAHAVIAREVAPAPAPESQLPKNLAREGNLTDAVERGHVLLAALEAANWDYHAIDQNLLLLPEQIHHENPSEREPWMWGFQPLTFEGRDELAFTSMLYTRQNVRVQPGIEASTEPEGHFIVGWKDGRVTTVPVSEARYYPITRAGEQVWVLVFAGMASYSTDLYQYGKLLQD